VRGIFVLAQKTVVAYWTKLCGAKTAFIQHLRSCRKRGKEEALKLRRLSSFYQLIMSKPCRGSKRLDSS
jgi:hypothetical protein